MLITWLDIVSTISNQVATTGFEWFKMQANPVSTVGFCWFKW